ncbi:MAG TPA: hypothetical protein VN524_05205 [Hyphomicrobiaceae bacterium]|nr:hypothetical protein [Hyphomicrobiaceae bacterium]
MLDSSTTPTATTSALVQQAQSLPALVARAAETLANAGTAAEVLDAGQMASFAYDVAKRLARLAKAKQAHDTLIAATHRAQADALEIEAQAKRRLADEYDAAQERGEVQKPGGDRVSNVPDRNNAPTVQDIGLTRKDIHEARQIRDAERERPGIVRQTLDAKLAAGEEPTRAAVKAAVARERPKAATTKAAEKRKPLAPDMRSAVEALMASDPALHREFLVSASEHLMDVDTICAVLRALLNRMHPKNVATLLVDVFGRPEFARAVADAMTELFDAREKEDDEAALGLEGPP